jgi:hypothetical protein
MSETVIVDEVKYDLFRRILAGIVSAGRHASPVAAAHMLTGEAYNDLIQAGVIRKRPLMEFTSVEVPVGPRPKRNECSVCGATRAMDPSPLWRYHDDQLLCPACSLFDGKAETPAAPPVQAPPASRGPSLRWTDTAPGSRLRGFEVPSTRNHEPICQQCGQFTKHAPAPGSLVFCEAGEMRCAACYQLLPEPKEALRIK